MFFLIVDVANAFAAALIGITVLIAAPRRGSAQLIALLSLSAIAHIVLGRYDYGRWIAPPYRLNVGGFAVLLNLARNAAPGLFMLLAHRLFSDRRTVPAWALALFAVQMLLEALPEDAGFGRAVTQDAPTLLQLVLAGLAIWWTVGNWRADLVDARRRVRIAISVILGLDVVASSLLLRVVIAPNSHANYQAHLVLSLVNLAILIFLLLRLKGAAGILLDMPPPRTVPPVRDDGDLLRLLALMEGDRVWLTPGLSLAALAIRIDLPEYRLRALIHEGLGYRNFNAFLHHYRIAEACARLADPQSRVPVLTIALSVGYNSLNTFNRGFREVTGMTPSAWRAVPPLEK